jgi:RNA polymerase sigma factor (sigma-70 family)
VLSGIADDQIPEGGRRPGRRRPDQLAIRPAGDAGGRSYEELYVEHAPVAQRIALSMVPRDVADDIVAEAFTRVLGAIRAGGGPGIAFRAYLLTAVRNTANDWLRASRRTTAIGDVEQDLEEPVPEDNMGVARLSRGPEAETEARAEARLVAKAFGHLPARWRAVLWQLEVEGKAPAAVAPMFGLSANGVSALAVRAREGLRQAYLQEHIGSNIPAACRSYAEALGADTRGRLSRRRRTAVHEHLEQCTGCHALANELTEVNSRLGAILTPAALAGAAAALASGGHGTLGVQAGAGLKGGAAREGSRAWLSGHLRLLRLHPVTVAAGAAAGLAAVGGMVFAVSVTPAGPGTAPKAARPAVSAAALSSSGPSAHVSVPGSDALGSAPAPAPVSGVTGSACPSPGSTASGACRGLSSAGTATPGTGALAGGAAGTGATGAAGAAGGAAPGSTGSPATSPAGPIRTITSGVGSALGSTVSGAGQVVSGLGQAVSGGTEAVGTEVGSATSTLGNAVSGTTQKLAGGLSGTGPSGVGSAVTNVGGAVGSTVQGAGSTVGGVTGSVGGVVGNAGQTVGGLLGGKS